MIFIKRNIDRFPLLALTLIILQRNVAFSFTPPIANTNGYRRLSSQLFLDGEGMAGKTFNKHLLGDILRALQPSYLSQVQTSIKSNLQGPRNLNLDPFAEFLSSGDANVLPKSREELQNILMKQQTKEELEFRSLLEQGLVHSPLATHRVFPNVKNDVSITFYRDSAAWCPYCCKVWCALEETQIPYKVVKVAMNCYAGSSKPAEFLRIQPSGSLPCAVIHREGKQDEVIAQSDDILTAIDSLAKSRAKNVNVESPPVASFNPFAAKSASSPPKRFDALLPTDEKEMEYVKFLCDDGRNSLERRLYAEWMWYLTGKRRPVEYRERFETILDEVNETLGNTKGVYFLESGFSMVDIKFIPFVERQVASLLYFKGFDLRENRDRWPNILNWLEAMEQRESYKMTKSDVYTHSRALPPQLSTGCTFYPGCEESRDAVDAYCLPTGVVSEESDVVQSRQWREKGWDQYYAKSPEENLKAAKREAAERILNNFDNIVKFASRAAGTMGFPASAAELADPNAVPNQDATIAVDAFLRNTIEILLVKNESEKSLILGKKVRRAGEKLAEGGDDTLRAIMECLDYLRLRIGVPRDMSAPAGQILRETLLEVSETLLEEYQKRVAATGDILEFNTV